MKKKNVFIVEDHPNWLELFTELLEDEYNVTTAKSYTEGMEALLTSDSPFHVVISDIRLEDRDPTNEEGLRLLAELDKVSDFTQSVVVTGYPSIRTAKKSLRLLNAFEYILKFPEDGSGFDHKQFRKVVRDAADEAEKQRPDAFVALDNRVLLVEKHPLWLNELASLLEYEKYQVDKCNNLYQLQHLLLTQSYKLIVLNYELTEQDPLLLSKIREHQSDVEILLTGREIDITEAVRMVQNRKIFSVIILNEFFDEQRFRVTSHRALAPKSYQYVLASIKEINQEQPLQVGETYTVMLTMQSKPSSEALSLQLAPRARGQSFRLKVTVYAEDIEIRPDKEVYWEMPASVPPVPLEFSFMANVPEKSNIYFNFHEGPIWLGGLTKEVEIISLKKSKKVLRAKASLQPSGIV